MRRSRRKAEPSKLSQHPVEMPSVPPQAEANGNTNNTPTAPKAQVSEQEASLTAKNYRLAKELVSFVIMLALIDSMESV